MSNLCPVCGFDLGFPAWNEVSASDEICPSCGIQFGYNDSRPESRERVYDEWRRKWLDGGAEWWSSRPPPEGWNPRDQLRKIFAQADFVILSGLFTSTDGTGRGSDLKAHRSRRE